MHHCVGGSTPARPAAQLTRRSPAAKRCPARAVSKVKHEAPTQQAQRLHKVWLPRHLFDGQQGGKQRRGRSATLQSSTYTASTSVARQLVGSLAAAAAAGSCLRPSPSVLLHLSDRHRRIVVAVDGDAVGQACVVLKPGRADIRHLLRRKRGKLAWGLSRCRPPLGQQAACCSNPATLPTCRNTSLLSTRPQRRPTGAQKGGATSVAASGPPFPSGCSFLGGPRPAAR